MILAGPHRSEREKRVVCVLCLLVVSNPFFGIWSDDKITPNSNSEAPESYFFLGVAKYVFVKRWYKIK